MDTYKLTKTAGEIWIDGSNGNLKVIAADVQQPQASGAADLPSPAADGSTRLSGVQGDMVLRVPYGSTVNIARHRGAVVVEGIAALSAHDIHGTLTASGLERLEVSSDTERASLLRQLLDHTDRSIRVYDVGQVQIEDAHGSLVVERAGDLRARNIGGGAEITAVRGSCELGNVGGSCEIADCGGDVRLKNVGGALRAQGIAGRLKAGMVGGSATISGCGGVLALNNVGGNLDMHDAPMTFDGSLRVAVGGSAHIPYPQDQVSLHAIAGGQIKGASLTGGEKHQITCGNGRNTLSLTVGGNLTFIEN